MNDADRFMSKVELTQTCWIWRAARNAQGYGQFWNPRRQVMELAHRWSYHHFVADLPPRDGKPGAGGVVVMHTCDTPSCVNPDHLVAGSQQDNMDDASSKGRIRRQEGQLNPNSRLTADDIAEIRRSNTGRHGERIELARRFGISSGHVSKILKGDSWTSR